MLLSRKFSSCCLAGFCSLVIAITGVSSTAMAQDFEIIEQRLGGLVADGELSLEQASVMLRALPEFAEYHKRKQRERERQRDLYQKEMQERERHEREMYERERHEHEIHEHEQRQREVQEREHQTDVQVHLRRLGVNDLMQQQARQTLESSGIHGERLTNTLQVIATFAKMMRSTGRPVAFSSVTSDELKKHLDLSDSQMKTVIDLATRFQALEPNRGDQRDRNSTQDRRSRDHDATEEKIVDWIESIGERLKRAVESGDLSENDAWKKWNEVKENEIAPKLEAAVVAGDLSEDRANRIREMIEKNELRMRSENDAEQE